MSSLSELFDAYSLRARIYPAFLTALPVVSLLALLWPESPAYSLWPLLVSVGVLFFLANWVRDSGRALESKLVASWGGMPTTLMLKGSGGRERASLSRRRSNIERTTGMTLPSDEDESADLEAANDIYVTATRSLITKVRSKQEMFPRVQDENTNYGFRRNLLAMKVFGLPISVGAAAFDVVWLVISGGVAAWVLLVLHALVILSWLFVINPAWVRRQGDNYAKMLFETMEDPRLTS